MCVIYIFTLFSALYFQAVLTTADNHTRAACKHCSLYFDVPPKPIFNSAVYVNMPWQSVGRFGHSDASRRLKPRGKLCWSRLREGWFIQRQSGRSRRAIRTRIEAHRRVCPFLRGEKQKTKGNRWLFSLCHHEVRVFQWLSIIFVYN